VIKIYFSEINNGESSHELLHRAVQDYYGKCDLDLSYKMGEKPYFIEPNAPKFSISHSEKLWICAISENEVGCDIQIHKPYPRYKAVAKRYFHSAEICKMNAAESPIYVFFDTWVKKEAVAKLTGRGLDSSLSGVPTADMPLFVKNVTLPIDVPYSAALASYESFDVNEISIIKM